MKLTEDQKQIVIDAGSIEMPVRSLAFLLKIPETTLLNELRNHQSEIYLTYETSRIETNNTIIKSLTEKAEAGDKRAVTVREKFIADVKFREERDKLFRDY